MAENEQNLTAGEAGGDEVQQGGGEAAAATAEAPAAEAPAAEPEAPAAPPEEITYHAVEKDGNVTAIWEMQGNKHLRTIDPRSRQGVEILRLYTAEHPE
ncbi:MAG TPA: hypothetical protein VEY09_12130 [Pyrinomonadaceae bacterium]|nr:hypothetical protein [Pyrinomonadaceae bacterium]